MDLKTFNKFRVVVAFFIAIIVGSAVLLDNMILALVGVVCGIVVLYFLKKKTKGILVDERMNAISNKAAQAVYALVTPSIALASLILTMLGRQQGNSDLESLGVIFSYIVLTMLALYSIFYRYYSSKYGVDNDKE